jgi:ribosomal protein S17E
MFSKPLYPLGYEPNLTNKFIEDPKIVKDISNSFILSYNDFFKKNIDLKKYKVPELKQIAKTNKIQVSGYKPALINRIKFFFNRSMHIENTESI